MLDSSSDRLASLMPDGVVLCRFDPESSELRVHSINEAGCKMLGLPEDQIIGRQPRCFMHNSRVFDDEATREQLLARLKQRGVITFPSPLQARGREGVLDTRVRMIWPRRENPEVVLIVEALGPEKEDEQQRRLDERLAYTNEVAGVMAHHLNNALGAARLELSSLHREVLGAGDHASSLGVLATVDAARDAISHATRIVQGFTSVASRGAGGGELVDLCELLAGLTELHGATKLRAGQCDGPIWVRGGAGVLHTVLDAVLGLLRASSEPTTPPTEVSIERDGAAQTVFVRLALGRPLPASVRRQLIDPATRTVPSSDDAVKYFGAFHVLRALGGDIGLARGAHTRDVVEILLPYKPEHVSAPGARPRLLLATADGAFADLLHTMDQPCSVSTASSGREALKLALQERHDVLVFDAETLELSAEELVGELTLKRASVLDRLLLIARDAPGDPAGVLTLTLPAAPDQLRLRIDELLNPEDARRSHLRIPRASSPDDPRDDEL